MNTRFLFSLFSFLILSSGLRAQQLGDFANCSKVGEQNAQARSFSSDMQRAKLMDDLFLEITKLQQEGATQKEVPPSLVKQCLQHKLNAFYKNIELGSESFKATARFHFTMGQLKENQGEKAQAHDYYVKASGLSPNDSESAWRAFRTFIDLQRERMEKAHIKSLSPKDLETFLAGSQRFLALILNNAQAPVSLRAAALDARARFLDALSPDLGQKDWKELLRHDPKNLQALERVAVFAWEKGFKAEARRTLEVLVPLAPNASEARRRLLMLQVEERDYAACRENARVALALSKQSSSETRGVRAFEVLCLAKLGMVEESEKKNSALLKEYAAAKTPRTDVGHRLALEAQGYVYVSRAEAAHKAGQVGTAVAEYARALPFVGEDHGVRKRMAQMIYEQREAGGFKPAAAAKADMSEVLKLLGPIIKKEAADLEGLLLYARAAAQSDQPASGAPICQRYLKLIGQFDDSHALLSCARNLQAAGQGEQARKLLEGALASPKYSKNRAELLEELKRAN